MSDQATSSATNPDVKETKSRAEPIYCKDCKFFNRTNFTTPHCLNEKTYKFDLVSGPEPIRCRSVREDETLCGFDAKLFAPALNLTGE